MSKKDVAVELVVIADRSGSMISTVEEAVAGFNRFVKEQKELPGKAFLTLVLYDDKYQVFYDRVDIQDVPELTVSDYAPYGFTATYDAVGKTLATLEQQNPEKAIVMIITDGGENSSKEYTKDAVGEKVKAAEDRGWDIVFLAQNMDAHAAGANLGMTRGITASLSKGADGMHEGFATMNVSAMAYRCA